MDIRKQQLVDWIKTAARIPRFDISPASEDASFRRYFRISFDAKTLIAMDAPPEKEDNARFIRLAQLLQRVGAQVPEIIEADLSLGFLLLSDLGQTQYLSVLNADNGDRLYGDALGTLLNLQTSTLAEVRALPAYDDALLTRELAIFDEWFVARHLSVIWSDAQRRVWQDACGVLKRSALEQPQVLVHRDYHSRNLMVTPQHNPGVLDFQDAVYGPITYDVASLLRDCYIAWPEPQVQNWLEQHRNNLVMRGVPVNDAAQFRRWFDLMGAQRHLKAIGIFARLNHRDGKPGYVKDIPRTLNYVLEVCGRYVELRDLETLLRGL
jgi:hypothetical protein